jgi:multidrug efflux pump subunit AcrA (membrane-fusion protein)
VEASRVAQVRARVTGIVQKRLFREGSDVKEGQPLFVIDPAPYQAALESAKAGLAKARANEVQATALATRYKPLREANAISQQEYVNAQAALRAEVPNPQSRLLPGMYVRARLVQGSIEGAILVPQQAVTRSSQADTVLVVGADGKPAPRPVKIAGAQGEQWIVVEGLKSGEQVIVEGFQKMRPGAPVKPVPWAGDTSSAVKPAAAGVASPAAASASR